MAKITPFGPKLKLTRAKRHIRDLQSLFDSFVSDHPHRIEFHEDEDGIEVIAAFDRPLPNETAPIIGDAIHNLRASLDHLSAEAVKAVGNEPSRNTGFPIYKAEADFNGGITSKLAGAPNAFINYVKSIKPYLICADGTAGNTALWALAQLDNLDKHLVILPTVSVVTLRNVNITTDNGMHLAIGTLDVSGGGKIANIAGTGAKYSADPDQTFAVRFTNTQLVDGQDVIGTLSAFEKAVSKVVTEATALEF